MKSTETSSSVSATTAEEQSTPTYKNPLFEILWFYLSFRHFWTKEQALIQQEHLRKFTLLHPEWLQEVDEEYGQTPLAMAVTNDILWAAKLFISHESTDKNPVLFYVNTAPEAEEGAEEAPKPVLEERRHIPCLLNESNEISPAMKDLLWQRLMPGQSNRPLARLLLCMEHGYHAEVDQILEAHQDDPAMKAVQIWINSMEEHGRTKKDQFPFMKFVKNILKKSTEHKTIYPEAVGIVEHVSAELHPALLAYAFTRSETRLCFMHETHISLDKALTYAVEEKSMPLLLATVALHRDMQKGKGKTHYMHTEDAVRAAIECEFEEAASYLLEDQKNNHLYYSTGEGEDYVVKAQQKGMDRVFAALLSMHKNIGKESFLRYALEHEKVEQVKMLLHVQTNYFYDHSTSAGFCFLIQKNEEAYLLQKVADLRDNTWFPMAVEQSILKEACKYGKLALVSALLPGLRSYVLQKDLHIEGVLWRYIETATLHGHLEVVELLLALPELQTYRQGCIVMEMRNQIFSSPYRSYPKEHQVESALRAAVRAPDHGLALTRNMLAHPFAPAIRTHFLCEFYTCTNSPEIKRVLLHEICRRKDVSPEFLGSTYDDDSDEIKAIIVSYESAHNLAQGYILGRTCWDRISYPRAEDRDPAFVLDALQNNPFAEHIPLFETLMIMQYAAEYQEREVVDALLAHRCWKKLPVGNDSYGWSDCLEAGIDIQHEGLVHQILHVKEADKYMSLDSRLCKACELGNEAIVRSILTSEQGRKIEPFWINAAKERAVNAGHPELVPVITSCLSWPAYLNQPRAEPAVRQAEQGSWCSVM